MASRGAQLPPDETTGLGGGAGAWVVGAATLVVGAGLARVVATTTGLADFVDGAVALRVRVAAGTRALCGGCAFLVATRLVGGAAADLALTGSCELGSAEGAGGGGAVAAAPPPVETRAAVSNPVPTTAVVAQAVVSARTMRVALLRLLTLLLDMPGLACRGRRS